MFHEIKGKNVAYDRDHSHASWTPIQSGGIVFTARPLTGFEPVTLTLEGTGAIELGITTKDPQSLGGAVPETTQLLEGYHFLNDVKIHKRKCTMSINLDESAMEVVSSYGGGHYKHRIQSNTDYFVVAEVKYGAVELRLEATGNDNTRQEFSENHGRNIKRLNNPAVTTSLHKSPAALCFVSEPLSPEVTIKLSCTPKPYQSTIPGRFYLLLRYTKQDPREFQIKNRGKFDVSVPLGDNDEEPAWLQIEKLEKDECTGNAVVLKFTGEAIDIWSAKGRRKRTTCHLRANEKVWLVLELYGITVRVETSFLEGPSPSHFLCPDIPEDPYENSAVHAYYRYDTPSEHENEALPVQGPTFVPASTAPPASPEDPVYLKDVIQKHFTYLKNNFTVTDVIDHMYENKMITHTELTSIASHQPAMQTRSVLVNILSNRPVSKKAFINALNKTHQEFLIEKFFPEKD
ncbi:hypothetical protein MAR_004617 [Mya arenaria]|uniref:Uncharacterized protein n=1 Tax=Mya arenaria TaxID=6604 RepID=A0ABY7EX36_MYAAR|nr:uncharacterized protein LOC128203702 [Mya arenaria]XP_052761188.1 uncharacterized protein LOC128203702 [Mya arenaria]WAR14512.1 hypothetical protein MAR_004617 [Mya arenaria]